MRPLSLTLEGFTCFKQRQTISFDGVELFAIWGPTGAGKTSLLDAMVFALFGKVPRLDEKRNRDVISLTREKAVVIFDFSSGTKHYRVVRTARRKGAPEAKLEDGDGNLLAEGVRGVETEILRCLGLSYDAFVQSVMLPQGEFARFLKSPPGQRRVILRDLLRTDVYERMRVAAEQRRREFDVKVSGLDQVLREYTDATPEHLKELEAELDGAQKEQQARQGHLAAVRTHLEDVGALRKKTVELGEARRHLTELNSQEPKVRATRLRIDASERAGTAMPRIARAEHAQVIADRESDAARKAKEAAEKEKDKYTQAEVGAQKADEDEKLIGPLRERIRALDGIRGIVETKRNTLARLETAQNFARAAEGRVRTADAVLKGLREGLSKLERRVERAKEALQEVAYDKELDALAQRVTRDAMQLAEERKQAARLEGEADRAEAAAAKARAEVEKKAMALKQARLKLDEASAALVKAERAYREAHALHAAAVLRRALRPGESCPVCAQQVRKVPKAIAAPGLDSIAEKYEQAKRVEAEAREGDKKIAAEYAGLEAAASERTEAAASAKEMIKKASAKVANLEGKLGEVVVNKFDEDLGTTIERRILSAGERLVDIRAKYLKGAEQLATLERDRDVAGTEITGKEAEAKQLQEAANLARGQVEQILAEVKGLSDKIQAVTTHPDPLAESADLEKNMSEIEGRVKIAKAAFAEARANLATALAVATGAAEKAGIAEEDAAALRREAEVAAKEARFDSLGTVKAAVVEPAELDRLRRSVDDYRVDYEATSRRILVLETDLEGKEVSEAELNEVGAKFQHAHRECNAAVAAVATLGEKIGQTRDRLEKRRQFGSEQDILRAELGVYRQLAEELRTDRFQEFILEEAFHDLAHGASERLKELTGRYALKYENGEILVVDHDNADEMRSADTLSGGETFLVSLALALELSAQIQQAAGAVLLESLFIDEGFGTLDAETLDSAATAVESLRGDGRMVGIVTHIRELADRLPCRIEVNWRSPGSQVEVHHS